MTLPETAAKFALAVQQQTATIHADSSISDAECQWHKGYLHGVVDGIAAVLGQSTDVVLEALHDFAPVT